MSMELKVDRDGLGLVEWQGSQMLEGQVSRDAPPRLVETITQIRTTMAHTFDLAAPGESISPFSSIRW